MCLCSKQKQVTREGGRSTAKLGSHPSLSASRTPLKSNFRCLRLSRGRGSCSALPFADGSLRRGSTFPSYGSTKQRPAPNSNDPPRPLVFSHNHPRSVEMPRPHSTLS